MKTTAYGFIDVLVNKAILKEGLRGISSKSNHSTVVFWHVFYEIVLLNSD